MAQYNKEKKQEKNKRTPFFLPVGFYFSSASSSFSSWK